jgi:hypothetical protein
MLFRMPCSVMVPVVEAMSSSADGALRDAQQVLGEDEDVVPQACLEVVFDLRQVEVRSLALGQEAAGVVEEVQAEVHDAAGDGFAIDEHVLFRQVPAVGTDHDGGQFAGRTQLVVLALEGGEVDPAFQRVCQVELSLDDVAPRRGGGVFHVGKPDLGAGVQRIDGHLLVHRAGDLNAPVLEVRSRGSDAPVGIVPDGLCFAEEAGVVALGDLLAAVTAALQQLLPGFRGSPVQLGNKRQSIRSKKQLGALDGATNYRDYPLGFAVHWLPNFGFRRVDLLAFRA